MFFLAAGSAHATEGGGGHYPNGAEDFMVGALPPPGTYFINYLSYYTADEFKDDSGGNLFPKFDLEVTANTLRFIHVTDQQFLGASWGMHAFIPLVNVDVTARFAPPLPESSDSQFGLGDIIIDPFILGWHTKNWHVTTGLDIYVPTGNFDAPVGPEAKANPGRNYWTFEPIVAFTYLSDGGIEVSAKFMYDFNTENDDTNYQSGQEFHFDYTLGYHIQEWSLGIGGYYYKQTTSDEVNGDTAPFDGFKGQAFAIGPQAKYDYKNMSFTLKYQVETDVENRPEGDVFWFKVLYVF